MQVLVAEVFRTWATEREPLPEQLMSENPDAVDVGCWRCSFGTPPFWRRVGRSECVVLGVGSRGGLGVARDAKVPETPPAFEPQKVSGLMSRCTTWSLRETRAAATSVRTVMISS